LNYLRLDVPKREHPPHPPKNYIFYILGKGKNYSIFLHVSHHPCFIFNRNFSFDNFIFFIQITTKTSTTI